MSQKLLFLHGYTQSGSSFAKKSAGLRKGLEKVGFTTHFPTAPVPLLIPEDAPEEEKLRMQSLGYKEQDSFAWFVKNDSTGAYDGLDKSWVVLKDYITKEGPFVGVVGFSQGSLMAALLISQIQTLVPSHPQFAFAILFSGFRPEVPEFDPAISDYKISIPTLQITGEKDVIVPPEKSKSLVEASVNPTFFQHAGGHFVPSNRETVTVVKEWITNVLEPPEAHL
ncbi:serine hydrolase FSH [Lipomyces japonicus]|uniref:serine hydrolase FSH n=1 Tax=Lipomyces japonicus TaxID=56871 RepID=UPI0034CD912A